MSQQAEMDPDLDAQWKKIQEKTFTRWVNEQLKVQKVAVKSLTEDFKDSVLLIVLLEVLSQKSIGKYNKKPKIHAQRMENLQKVLTFITDVEGIRLVNIGAGDIVEGNLKLILGLVWTLILHYQISLGFDIDDDDGGPKKSGKQALLEYIQKKIPHKNIKNFTSDWSDGTAVAALVDAHAPGLCPEADSMDPKNALQNATHAMKLADDWLGIPQVLGPEDMVNPHVDELSMMTYLSQFPEAQLKDGAPIGAKTDMSKVKVSGPGVTGDGVKVGEPAKIIVDCSESGVAPITGKVKSPSGEKKDVVFEPTDDPNVFEGSYSPADAGEYEVGIDFDGRPLPSMPIKVQIRDPDKVKVSGPGVTGEGANVGKPAEIIVDCSDSGVAPVTAKVTTPNGDTKDVEFKPKAPGSKVFTGSYTPDGIGNHNVEVDFDGKPVGSSPYQVDIKDIDKVQVSGPGITGEGVKVGEPAKIIVDCTDSGVAPVTAKVKSPSGEIQDVVFEPLTENPNVFEGCYTPVDAGQHEVAVDFDGRPLPTSPIKVPIKDISKVKVGGSGITGEGARVGKPANVIVDCSDSGVAPVAVRVTDPSGNAEDVKLLPKAKNPNVFEGFYTPKEPGYFGAEVKFDDEEVPNSPYQVAIGKPESARISGDGLDKAFVGEDNVIDVFTDDAGPGDITANFSGPPKARPVVQNVVKVDDNHYQVHFSPQDAGVYDTDVCLNGFPVESKPRKIPTVDLSKVEVTGPGIKSGNPAKKETYFNVDARRAGDAEMDISITDPQGKELPLDITTLEKNACRVKYTPQDEGDHVINIKYGGRDLKDSPYFIKVDEPGYVKCTGDGLSHATVNVKAYFEVDATKVGPGSLGLGMEGPADIADVLCEPGEENGKFKVSYTAPLPGKYKISVKFNDEEVRDSPFEVHVSSGRGEPDAQKCIVNGIESGQAFTVDCSKGGGNGLLEVGVCGCDVPADYVQVKHLGDYKFDVSYHISVPGETTIIVKWHGEHLDGSPFTIITK